MLEATIIVYIISKRIQTLVKFYIVLLQTVLISNKLAYELGSQTLDNSCCRLLMESSHRLAISWHLILVTNVFVTSELPLKS